MTVKELAATLRAMPLCPADPDEAAAIASLILEEVALLRPVDVVLKDTMELPEFTSERAIGVARRVMEGTPVQYALGVARFHGLTLKVTPAGLIPRPETSQLVDLVADHCAGASDLRVLDAGTGSGCIAIALARTLRFPQVTAIDISADALTIAADNARRLKAAVTFRQADMLELQLPGPWHVIVSNPPYVLESERAAMEPRVTDHEPATALFVPDADPLRFYRALLDYGQRTLSPSGSIFFEINPLEADSLRAMATAGGWGHCSLERDSFGRVRFAIISRHR